MYNQVPSYGAGVNGISGNPNGPPPGSGYPNAAAQPGYPQNTPQQPSAYMGSAPRPSFYQTAPNTSGFGGPPPSTTNQFGGPPPPPTSGMPPSQVLPPPKSGVQFFSLAGGTPTPVTNSFAPPSVIAPPPGSIGGGYMPPPPTGVPPPPTNVAGVPFMAVPPGGIAPSGYPAQPDYPGQIYGAPPANSLAGMPAAFDSSSNLMGTNADVSQAGAQVLPRLDEMDMSIQCNPIFLRCTVGKLLNTQDAANRSRMPLGVVCRPMAGDVGIENNLVDVVDFGSAGIIRCKRCRTYINPFVAWMNNGRQWRCNICGMSNDVPTSYFSHLDVNGQRRDKDQRPELSCCSVEFVAPGDYMVRPPQPPVYFFLLDVSNTASSTGMLACAVNAIKASIDSLPGLPRTQIGFLTFDTSVHFYNLKAGLKSPQMLVVSDINDLIMPSPDDLLANLQESRHIVEALLDSIPTMFQGNTATTSCLGPALMAAKRVIQHVGGKIILLQMGLPSIGEGALKPRENVRLIGTDKEHTLLNAEEAWYKNNAIDFSRLQIAVDVFQFSNQFADVATLSILAKYSSGSCYYYPGFYAPRDGQKFHSDLTHLLTRATGFEAVMRVRATRGIRISNFYGNYFIRGTDLLALPNCHSDSVFALDMTYDDPVLNASAVTIQAALLYTTSSGERRIRVHTMVVPVTQSVPELLESVDLDCCVNILAKQAVELAQKSGLENARSRTHQQAVEVLRAAKTPATPTPMQLQPGYGYHAQAAQQDIPIPVSLQLMPLYAMSLQKSLIIRGGADVRIDERAFFHQLVSNMDVPEAIVFVYPRLFSVHNMGPDVGIPVDNADEPSAGVDHIRLPGILNLSSERLTSDGLFLLENGYDLFLWIGRNVSAAMIQTLFGVTTLDGVDTSTMSIQPENSDYSFRLNAVIQALRSERSRFMQLNYIREGDGYGEAFFARFLVEDRANFNGGTFTYTEYHTHVTRQVSGLPG